MSIRLLPSMLRLLIMVARREAMKCTRYEGTFSPASRTHPTLSFTRFHLSLKLNCDRQAQCRCDELDEGCMMMV
ncbi:hypothetical protein BDN71DRAFT_1455295 [Pleurotus eryngii]|uniref:Secreted protein n=1 Tax=Pleurotus eryngii TaxID=5323 RepID=A0A9P5ZMR9_PLEER|nr:hypothetical protein BDN71DRAFT_1455295 [Pleurotus eryngii]